MKMIPTWRLKELSERTARQYYSYMRKEALRRLAVLKRNNMIDYIDYVPEITQARGRSFDDVYNELREINQFLKNPFSKITYARKFEKDIIQQLRDQGYSNINSENIREFNQYIGELKKAAAGFSFDSDRAVEVFDEAKRLNLDYSVEELIEKYDYLRENLNEINEIQPVKGNKPMTQKELKTRVTKWKNQNRK